MKKINKYLILTILFTCVTALLSGMLGGLKRMGWQLPGFGSDVVIYHGPLIISGFLGTLISLERAKGLGSTPAYLSPLLTGCGTILLLTGLSRELSILMITAGSFGLILIFLFLLKIQFNIHGLIMAAGALFWFTGNILWLLNTPAPDFIAWWISFLVITIAAERLELSRIVSNSGRARWSFLIANSVLIAGTFSTLTDTVVGMRLSGSGMVLLGIWLLTCDIARRTVFSKGLSRFMAISLLSGYGWLVTGGLIAAITGSTSGFLYDAMLHSVFLGFVFSMIFAHAPVILPAVTGARVSYMPTFYIHLVLLHFSLGVRVAGDLLGLSDIRSIGGLLNVIVIFIFIFNTAFSVYSGSRSVRTV